MSWKTMGAVVVSWTLLLGVAGGLEAQEMKDRTDLTGRQQITPEEVINGLTPRSVPRTRGLKTRGLQPNLATIAVTIHFAFDSAELLPNTLSTLNSLGQALQSPQLAPYQIRIEGHTDSSGPTEYNQGLSERRAESVKQYLASHFNVATDRLMIVGRGEDEPMNDNDTREGRQKNRRVEFVNLGQP
jgi:outer membrane protein OmpA-like peptidoglycan-associated protein